METYFYLRIDTDSEWDEKKYYRQEKALQKYAEQQGCSFDDSYVYRENCYGGIFHCRKEWHHLVYHLHEGDTIVMKDVNRFSTSRDEGFRVYMELFDMGVNLLFLDNPAASTQYLKQTARYAEKDGVVPKEMFYMTVRVMIFAELEHALLDYTASQRKIRSGMALSDKKPGRPVGRREKMTVSLGEDIYSYIIKGGTTKLELECKHNISRVTLSNYIKYYKENIDELRQFLGKDTEHKD